MRPQMKWPILTLALMAALPSSALGGEEDARSKQLDTILTKAVAPGQPGLAVLVKKDEHILFEKGYGVRIRDIHACGTAEPRSGSATSSNDSRWIA